MSNTGGSIKDEVIRELQGSTLTTSYQTFGAVFTRDCFRLWITNNTNGDVYLSTDGINNMKKLPANSGRAYDDKTNDMFRKKGTQWYIKFSTAPATPSGWVALEAEYV